MKKLIIAIAVMGILLSACSRSPSAEIIGVWELVSYGDPASPTPAALNVDTSIEFKPDGTLSGNVGCNSFGGDYEVKGDTIEFSAMMSTEMFCEAVADQESTVLAVFSESVSFKLEGDTLTITSADGTSAVVLKRK